MLGPASFPCLLFSPMYSVHHCTILILFEAIYFSTMGIFARFRPKVSDPALSNGVNRMFGSITKDLNLEGPEIQLQLHAMGLLIAVIALVRLLFNSRLKALNGVHVLDLSALNDACMYKEVFLAYLNAALLEPVLTIGGLEEAMGQELAINIFTLGSICWWIWMVTDAFDYADVCQSFKYHVDLREEAEAEPKRYEWLRMRPKAEDAASERRTLAGSVQRDVALWFSLASIGAAWLPGPVTHRDVMHAYAIVILWLVVHHSCRRATTWSTIYFVTFLFPSTALMPMEYCLPLMDTFDCVEDLEFVESYREFVKERTGVELVIIS